MEKIFYFKSNGANLAAVFHMPEKKGHKVPLVVINHGFGGSKSGHLQKNMARRLAKAGIAALRFDCFACGDSEGEFKGTDFFRDLSDANNAIDLAKKFSKIDKNRIGIFGASKGGYLASILCGSRDDIKAAVILCAPADYPKLWDLRYKKYGKNKGIEMGVNFVSPKLIRSVYELGTENLTSVANYRNPILFIHGTKDEVLDRKNPETYYRVSGSKQKKLVMIRGSDHNFSSLKWENQALKEIIRHYKKYL